MNHFDSLPNELVVEIFKNLDFTQLKIPDLQLVCKRFYSLSRHPSLYSELRVPSHLNFIQISHYVKQRSSIKTLTIVGAGDYEKLGLHAEQLDVEIGTASLPVGRIYVSPKRREGYINEMEHESQGFIPDLLEHEVSIDTLIFGYFKTYGSFDVGSKNFLSNLQSLYISEEHIITDNDLINIANSCQRLKSFSFAGCLSDSAYDIFFKRVKSTLTDLSIWVQELGRGDFNQEMSQHALDSLTQCTKLTRFKLKTNCDKLKGNQLSKERLPLLKSLFLIDSWEEGKEFRNFTNWFQEQNFSQLTELNLKIFDEANHSPLPEICSNCPNLVKLSLRGEFFFVSDQLHLLRQFQHLETVVCQTGNVLNWDDFQEMLRHFEIGVTNLKMIDLFISNDISIEDIRGLMKSAKKGGIVLRILNFYDHCYDNLD